MDSMHIQSISLKNYRMFRDFTCDFDPGLTVLVADNGGGKTTILDGIRVAFGPYLRAFPKGRDFGIAASDVYCHVSKLYLTYREIAYPATIEVDVELDELGLPRKWLRSLKSAKSKTTVKDAHELLIYANGFALNALGHDIDRHLEELDQRWSQLEAPYEDKVEGVPARLTLSYEADTWPLLAYYGTGRLWVHKKLPEKNVFADGFDDRSVGYADCMDPATSYQSVSLWLRHAERSDFDAKLTFAKANPSASAQDIRSFEGPFAAKLRGIRRAINVVMAASGWGDISWSPDADVTLAHDELGILPVSQLSDGIRNTIGLVTDLAWRAVQLNPHLGERAVQDAFGIVLIDEVDMHLHPSWQQTILASLREAFPKIQFIVTTHSPQVLSTVRRENIRVISRMPDGSFAATTPLTMSYGEESGHVLQGVMGVDQLPPIKERADLQRLTSLFDQGAWSLEEAQTLLKKLTNELGEHHPQLQQLVRSKERQEFMKTVKFE